MRVQISSGQGPAECGLAVGLFYRQLQKEGRDIRLIQSVRAKHRRKNWFIDVSVLEQLPDTQGDMKLRFETFRSKGKGGQHVNKVETGVRVIHVPTGISVVSTEARSQHMNKKLAMNRLCDILADMELDNRRREKELAWMEHTRLERGNPVRVYEGMDFIRKK